jgi:NAD(P)-dependent dehydrogenase (short-subunit alcohol dehydrogenase family)
VTTLSKEATPSRSIPLGRFAEVDDVADTVLYLLSDLRSKVFFQSGPAAREVACLKYHF